MKKLLTLLLLMACLKNNAQRLNSIELRRQSNIEQLTTVAREAQVAAQQAHTAAATAHTNAIPAGPATLAGNAHTTAAADHTTAANRFTAAAGSFVTTAFNFTTATASKTTATASAATAVISSLRANTLLPDGMAIAADATAASADKAANEASKALLEAADDHFHVAEIDGLGNIANSQNGTALSASASINAKIHLTRNNKRLKLYLGFNLGADLDSTKIDSIKLGNLFLPDRSKAGYLARLEYNVAAWFKWADDEPKLHDNGYTYFWELSPFIEYNYNKVNIKGVKEDSSKIQTSTWLYGINFNYSIGTPDNKNTLGLQVMPYVKTVNISAGTFDTYNAIFKPTLKQKDAPRKVSFIGITMGLQVNRFLFSFDYQSLKTSSLDNTPLSGGIFTVRATVIGDLIKL